MKLKRIFALLMISIILVCTFGACGSADSSPVGKWYNEKGRCLDIREDYTWKLEHSYGTGHWKYLSDKVTIEFTDFYGDTQESSIKTDDQGQYINFGYYGDFYRENTQSSSKSSSNLISIASFSDIIDSLRSITQYTLISIVCPPLSGIILIYFILKSFL